MDWPFNFGGNGLGRRNGMNRHRDALRRALEQKPCTGKYEYDASNLRTFQYTVKKHAAANGIAPELGYE
jgi:hypothetical protein